MSELPETPDQQRNRDIAAYGYCWCGEPRRGRTYYDVDTETWWTTMICYAGHGDQPEDSAVTGAS